MGVPFWQLPDQLYVVTLSCGQKFIAAVRHSAADVYSPNARAMQFGTPFVQVPSQVYVCVVPPPGGVGTPCGGLGGWGVGSEQFVSALNVVSAHLGQLTTPLGPVAVTHARKISASLSFTSPVACKLPSKRMFSTRSLNKLVLNVRVSV